MNRYQRLDRLAKTMVDYKLRRTAGRVLPLRVWLEPTNKCNLRCSLCPQSSPDRPKHGFMDASLYRKIIDEIAGYVHDVNLSHRGESLFHEEIIDFIAYAHRAGLKTRIHTNGTILTERMSEQLIDAGLDFLSFSFDGFTREVYEQCRVGAVFDETVDHIRTFLRVKKQKRAVYPFTVLQVIRNELVNEEHIATYRKAFLDLLEGFSLDKLYIKHPHNWGGNVHQETAERLAMGQGYTPCTFCWYSMTILWDGTVVPCPQDFYAILPVGDVRTQTLRDIWRGNTMVTLRDRFTKRLISGLHPCETCDRIFRPSLFGIPSVNMKEFLAEHLVGYQHLQDIYKRR